MFLAEGMGVPPKTEQRRSHTTVSSFGQWVRRAEGYWGTCQRKFCMEVPVIPRRPPSPPLICAVFLDHSSFSVSGGTPMTFTRYPFKRLKGYHKSLFDRQDEPPSFREIPGTGRWFLYALGASVGKPYFLALPSPVIPFKSCSMYQICLSVATSPAFRKGFPSW
jgi:hypothetical protein